MSICLSLLVIIFLAVHFGGEYFLKELQPSQMEQKIPSGETVTVRGQIYRREQTSKYQILYLKKNIISYQNQSVTSSNLLIYDENKEALQVGNIIQLTGEVSYFERPRNPGNFDRKFYYQKQNIQGSIWSSKIAVLNSHKFFLRETLAEFRNQWKESLLRYAGEKDGGILCAMILGDKSGMDEDIKTLYQQNGIAHVLAISGLHLSFLGIGFYKLIRRQSGSYLLGGLTGIFFLGLYILMIGMSVSAVRALIMYIIRVGADMTGRVYDAVTALSVAALVVIFWRPLSFYDGGFQLSFGAVAGIIFLSGAFEKWNQKRRWQGLAASLSIQMVTFPILLYHFYEFPPYAVFLNLIIIPLMSVLLGLGMLGSLGLLIFAPMGEVLIMGCRGILGIYEWFCTMVNKLPLSQIITGQPKIIWILGYYICLTIAIVVLRNRKHTWAAGLCVMMGSILLLSACPFGKQSGLSVTMLDIGQGDCIFLKNDSGACYLVDGGSSNVKNVGKYRIEPFLKWQGVSRVDYIFISHGDGDHISGVEELLQRQSAGIDIGCLVFPEEEVFDEALVSLARSAREKGVRTVSIKYGQKLTEGNLSFTCVAPEDGKGQEIGNESSMVLDVSYGQFDMLLTGDVEGQGEERLVNNLHKDYDVLKVAHHGSKNSTSEEFLDKTKPEIALISAGQNNSYGHPNEETLNRLESVGCMIYSTKESGAVMLKTDGKTIAKPEVFQYNESYEKFE